MSQVRRPQTGATEGIGNEDERLGSPATKVVLMELVRAGHPLSTGELRERTLLASAAIESALETLREQGLCLVRAGDDRRPTRFEVELPPAAGD